MRYDSLLDSVGNTPLVGLPRLSQCPEIIVEFVDSDRDPGGLGEIGVPVVAPAIANALYAATEEMHDAGQFEAVYHVDSDTSLDGVVKELAQRPISTVVNGFDTGCSLWVKLCNALGFPHRPAAELSHVLGNKYRTGNHIRGKGIVVAKSVLVTSANASHCIEQIESCIEYPLVIKPTESAGSFGVHVCHDRREAETAIATLLDKADVYGNVVSEVVAEELLWGPEYSVCTVTSHGQHVVSAVFTYE